MSKPKTNALVTLTNLRPVSSNEEGKLAGTANLNRLISRANEQYGAIKDGDRSNALRGIFLGLLFWQIKNECGHGNFMKIATERMPAIPQRTRGELMKLALAYVDKCRVALPERLTIPDAQIALTGDSAGTEAEMVKKAIDFIGELSLHELLIKHDIRGVGLKKDLTEGTSEPDPDLPPDEVLRRRRDEVFGSSIEHLSSLHKVLTNTESLTLLDNTQLETIENQLVELRQAIAAVRKPSA